jgi:hypothetical protein
MRDAAVYMTCVQTRNEVFDVTAILLKHTVLLVCRPHGSYVQHCVCSAAAVAAAYVACSVGMLAS